MKMRAAVLMAAEQPRPYETSKPVAIVDVDLAPPGAGEVLVEIKAAGVCHSDLSVVNGTRKRPLPMALGHEAAGIIAEVGPGVSSIKPGDHIAFIFAPSCGHCEPCLSGRPGICEPGSLANAEGRLLGGGKRLSLNGAPVHHQSGVSCFAEYVVASEHSVIKIDKTLPLDEAALFSCAVITGVGAVLNTAAVPPGASVCIVGLGGVGLNALLAAKMIGAEKIVAIDVLDSKLTLARQLGATDTFNAGDANCLFDMRDATGGGCAYTFEAAGTVAAMELAFGATRRGGSTVLSGLSHPDHTAAISHLTMVAEERTLKGSYMGSCVPVRDIPRYIQLYQQGLLPVDKLLSERIALDDINIAFDKLDRGETIRQVVLF